MPVLLLGGGAANTAFYESTLTPAATDVRVQVVPDSGHWLSEENPRFVEQRILRFVGA